jgi:hypothetical protein
VRKLTIVELLPWLAGTGAVAFILVTPLMDGAVRAHSWLFPAGLALLFLGWSLAAGVVEGPVGFWQEHTRSMWGNQIWFDLLLAIGVGCFLIIPQAKALHMRVYPWLVLIICTGCIGFLAMVSRLMYLREHAHEKTMAL